MEETSVECMVHMGNMVMGIAFGTAATIWKVGGTPSSKGAFCYVEYEDIGDENKPLEFPPKNSRNREAIKNPNCGWFFRASAADFKKIPGSPVAYWVSENIINAFSSERVEEWTISEGQNITANNDKFVRNTWEVSASLIGRNKKWLSYAKGGDYRKLVS